MSAAKGQAKTIISGRNDEKASDSSEAPRVLFILNEKDSILSTLSYLKKVGYQLTFASNVMDAMASVLSNRPDIAMVSWNLKAASPGSVVNLLTVRLKIRCIVFGEENDRTTEADMIKAGFSNTLPAPLNGIATNNRIKQVLSRRVILASAPIFEREKFSDLVQVNSKPIPPSTKWEEIQKDGQTMWKGTAPGGGMTPDKLYFFVGAKPPKYSADLKMWEGAEMGAFYEEKETPPPALTKRKLVVIAGDPIPEDTIWEQKPSEKGGLVWEGRSRSAKKKDIYIFDGKASPVYSAKEKKWGGDTGGIFYHTKKDSDVNQRPDDEDDNFEGKLQHIEREEARVQAELRNAEAARDNLIAIRKVKKHNSVLATCLEEAVSHFLPNPTIKDTVTKTKDVMTFLVNSTEFKGYLVMTGSLSLDQKLVQKIIDQTRERMQKWNMPLTPSEIMSFEIPKIDFYDWASKHADFVVIGHDEGQEIAFVYLPIQKCPEVFPAETREYVGVDIQHDLLEELPVLFDVFIHLPMNQKFVRFLKKHAIFDSKAKEKFASYDVKKLYIKANEVDSFEIYCAKSQIMKTLNKDNKNKP